MQITWRPNKRDFTRGVAAVWGAILDFIYPPHCLLCRGAPLEGERTGLCTSCRAGLEAIEGPHCPRCGCPAGAEDAPCRNCAGKVFTFSRMRALAPFNDSMQRLIHMLKYEGRTPVGRVLGQALGEALAGDALVGDALMILPVPLHGSRQRERGYNQSALIARAAGAALGLPVREGILRRVRPTQTQTALDLSDRMANVKGAFRVRRADLIQGERLLLLDDVVTTGATTNACAEALLDAGAKEVVVAAAASPYFGD